MEKITSKDGTMIAYQRSSAGPPLVLVHGTAADHTRWAPILPGLEQHFSVYAIDRRGRGESGDADTYAIEREFEDVAAVVGSLEEPATLLGHSYGAICSLEAALLTQNVHKLILYEGPAIPPGMQIYPEGLIDRLQALLDRGAREEVVTTFMREMVRVPPHELELLRSLPAWKARVAAAHTIPRELRAHEQYSYAPERFMGLTTPTVLLLGGESPPFLKAGTEAVHAALPNSRVVVMPGQRHTAMDTAPELFTREVVQFFAQENQTARL